jgi:hypothetical protein
MGLPQNRASGFDRKLLYMLQLRIGQSTSSDARGLQVSGCVLLLHK